MVDSLANHCCLAVRDIICFLLIIITLEGSLNLLAAHIWPIETATPNLQGLLAAPKSTRENQSILRGIAAVSSDVFVNVECSFHFVSMYPVIAP